MKVTFEVSGGFVALPGVQEPRSIDTATVDVALSDQVEAILRDVVFFEMPARLDTSQPGAADYFVYTITVRDGDRVHSVTLTDPVADERMAHLINILKTDR